MQNDFVAAEGQFARSGIDVSPIRRIVPGIIECIRMARRSGVMVIHLQNTTLREARSESPAWLRFKSRVTGAVPEYTLEGSWGHQYYEGLEPQKGEPVIQKLRPSAFVNSSLDQVLRSNGINSLVLTGCITNGCVLATALHGAYMNYFIVVAKDCVASSDPELHDAAIKIMGSRFEVVDSKEIFKAWSLL
jgi:nicotinamidase-related amidase